MYLLILGVLLSLLKYFEVGPMAAWPWWWVLSPFALAWLWWMWADFSGYTKRQELKKEAERKALRIDNDRKRMGLPPVHKRK